MKMHAYVAGVGMTRFGKQMDKTLKGLAGEAVQLALADAGLDKSALQAAWMGNAAAGIVTGQEMIRGQLALRPDVWVDVDAFEAGSRGDRDALRAAVALYRGDQLRGHLHLVEFNQPRLLTSIGQGFFLADQPGLLPMLIRMTRRIFSVTLICRQPCSTSSPKAAQPWKP